MICPDCEGTGRYGGPGSYHDTPSGKPCATCNGKGTVEDPIDNRIGDNFGKPRSRRGMCPARSPESNLPCRLGPGHPGVHEATVNDTVTACWSEDRHPTPQHGDRPVDPWRGPLGNQ